MMNIVLYSTNCPKCKVLEKKLDSKHIAYEICTSVEIMLELGIQTAPVLSVDGKLLQFKEAIDWVQNQ